MSLYISKTPFMFRKRRPVVEKEIIPECNHEGTTWFRSMAHGFMLIGQCPKCGESVFRKDREL